MQTNNIGLKYLQQNQASPEVLINESLTKLDALLFNIPKDIVATLPQNPKYGDVYICNQSHQTNPNNIAIFINSSWVFFVPQNGMTASVQATGKQLIFQNNQWQKVIIPSPLPSNVNFDDSTNTTRLNINKATEGGVASHIFKNNWGGRAEFGLIGEDNFALKVSADGTNFNESFKVDKSTGNVDFKQNITKNNINLATINDLSPYARTTALPNNNYIINGNFDVWQRGTAFTSNGANQYFADRWCGRRADSTSRMQISQTNTSLPACSALAMRVARIVGDTSTSNIGICQIIDPSTVMELIGTTITISAKIRLGAGFANASGVIRMQLISGTVANEGGNPFAFTTGSVVVGTASTPTTRSTWHNLRITVLIPATVRSLMVSFISEAPSGTAIANDCFDISQVKLEIGNTQTQFLPTVYNTELFNCQHYYERINAITASSTLSIGFADGTNIIRSPLSYKQKRQIPRVTINSQTAFNILRFGTDTTSTAISFATVTPLGCRIDITTAGGVTGGEANMINFANSTQFIEIDGEI